MEGREFKDSMFGQFERVARAFASAPRLEIVDLLAQSERSVESIADQTGLTVANTSRHLQVLRQAGVVARRRDRQQLIYRLADPTVLHGYQALREVAESAVAEVSQLARAFFTEVDGAEPVSSAGLQDLMRDEGVLVVDVRPAEEFAAGHLAGAVNIPLADLARTVETIPDSTHVVAYCRGPYCVLAAEAVDTLRRSGHRAQRLAVGFPEWQTAGYPVESGPNHPSLTPTRKPTPVPGPLKGTPK